MILRATPRVRFAYAGPERKLLILLPETVEVAAAFFHQIGDEGCSPNRCKGMHRVHLSETVEPGIHNEPPVICSLVDISDTDVTCDVYRLSKNAGMKDPITCCLFARPEAKRWIR